MFKRCISLFPAALLTLCLFAGCSSGTVAPAAPAAPTAAPQTPQAACVGVYKIADAGQSALLLCGARETASSQELISLPLQGLPLYDAAGAACQADLLRPGMLLEVGSDGSMLETFPSGFGKPAYAKIAGQEDDLVSFYRGVVRDFYKTDEALNADISYLAFDLSGAENLTPAEASALTWLCGGDCGLGTLNGTFAELCSAGFIDAEKLYFPDGVLFEFKTESVAADSFTFSVSKWRGGLGAVGASGCTAARQADGAWGYTPGAMWIA